MKAFFRRLFGKPKPKQKELPSPPPEKAPEPKPRKNTSSSFEPLEGRIAPAVLLNPSTVQYTDTDGDLVTITFSKAIFTGADASQLRLNDVFQFKDPNAHVFAPQDGGHASDVGELALIDLTKFSASSANSPAAGISFTIDAKPQNGTGNDLVNIGYIKASTGQFTGLSLGDVVVDGDLGQIDAGDVTKMVGVKSLTVQSIGTVGVSSQNASGSLISNITGQLQKLVVKGDFVDANIKVVTGLPSTSLGKIGSITIGGQLRVSAVATATDIGQIVADNDIGSVTIGGLAGGSGNNTGLIKAGGKMGTVKVLGDIRGGAGKDSGEIAGIGGIGSVTITGDLWAGTGENSGRLVSTTGSIGLVSLGTLHGDTTFGSNGAGIAGKNAATISASGGLTGLTTLGGILGGKGDGSGSVAAGGVIGKVSIGMGIVGGDGAGSGRVSGASIVSVTIAQTITGGVGSASGSISTTGNFGSVTVKNMLGATGALVAGKGASSGSIIAGGSLGTVTITGNLDGLRGGELDGHLIDVGGTPTPQVAGVGAASVSANTSIAKLSLTGSLTGGVTDGTASITAGTSIGALAITGNLVGGTKLNTGSVVAGGRIASATIQGSLQGGAGEDSGALLTGLDIDQNGDLTKATVTGSLQGGAGTGSGSLRVGGRLVSLTIGVKGGDVSTALLHGGDGGGSGSIFTESGITMLNVLGTVQGGTGTNSGAIYSNGAATTVKIAGALTGSVGDGSGSLQVHDLDLIVSVRPGDLGTLTIGGAVTGNNGIGSGAIVVEGSAKSLTLGALTGGSGAGSGSLTVGGGTAAMVNDYQTIGGAASITIKGALTGTANGGNIDVASKLGALSIQGAATGSSVLVGRDLGKLTINGAVDDVLVSAQGRAKASAKADLTIGSITINGNVSDSIFRAGYDRFGNPVNGNAQVGKVSVTGDWTASSLVAGVEDVNGDGFGNADDVAIPTGGVPISKIAGIIITGQVTGTASGSDHFGFTAGQITSVKIGGVVQALTKTGLEVIDLPGSSATNDISIREVV